MRPEPNQSPDGAAKLEERLRRTEQKCRLLSEHARYGTFQVTREGRLLEVNKALVGMLGYKSKRQLKAANLANVFEHREQFGAFIEAVETSGGQASGTVYWAMRNGFGMLTRLAGRPVWGEEGKLRYVEGVVEELGGHARGEHRENMVTEWECDLEGVLEELIPVLGHSDLLLLPGNLSEEDRKEVEEIPKAALLARSIRRKVEQLYRQQWEPAPVSLNKLARELEEFFRPLLAAGVQWENDLDPELGTVLADAAQVKQMAMNLVNHARLAMPKEGILTVKTRRFTIDPLQARTPPLFRPGRYYGLSVRDTGRGFTSGESVPPLIEHMMSSGEEDKNSGLGLSLVAQLTQQSRGYVHASSDRANTWFEIVLPVFQEARGEETQPSPSEFQIAKVEDTILVIEEEENTRKLVAELLRSADYAVLSASIRGAVDIVKQHTKPICLIVSDLEFDWEVEREVMPCLASQTVPPRLLYTGMRADWEWEVTEKGAAFLQKPFLRSELLRKVAQVLGTPPGRSERSH